MSIEHKTFVFDTDKFYAETEPVMDACVLYSDLSVYPMQL